MEVIIRDTEFEIQSTVELGLSEKTKELSEQRKEGDWQSLEIAFIGPVEEEERLWTSPEKEGKKRCN